MVDYLSSRSQYVFVNGNRSNIAEIVTGVPQGSVLGSFLFLVYINDFPQTVQSDNKIALFADDKSIMKTGKGNCNMQSGLDKICDWFNYNKLSINTTKCETMSFGSNYQNTLTVHNEVISRNTFCKYLGVYIEWKLTFTDHINYVVKKLNKFCGLIYRGRDIYPIKCLMSFYNAYARSVICYVLLFMGAQREQTLKKLKWHKGELLEPCYSKKYDSLQDILRQTKLNTVFELFIVDVFREIFNQLRTNGTTKFSKLVAETKHQKTEDRKKGSCQYPIAEQRVNQNQLNIH